MPTIIPKELVIFKSYLSDVIKNTNSFKIQTYSNLYADSYKCMRLFYENWFPKIRQYSDAQIGEQLFKLEFRVGNEKDFVRYNIYALLKSFDRINTNIVDIYNSNRSNSDLIAEISFFEKIIWDTLYFIQFANAYMSKSSTRLSLYVRKYIDSKESYEASLMLLKQTIIQNVVGDYAIRPLSVFLIRQAIELRLKNAIGIDTILDNKGRTVKIGAEHFLHIYKYIIKYHSDEIEFPVKISILEKILEWSQYFIHAGLIPYFWQIEWAHYSISPLFEWGSHGNTRSAYGSIKIKQSLYDNIQNIIKEHLRRKKVNKFKRIFRILFRNRDQEILNYTIRELPQPESLIT